MRLALIPARGGSKRIPRKNIRLFAGRPIITYAIDVARESGLFDQIVVSTDDREIADIAIAAGASVPFFRPEKLADDHASTMAVINHAVAWHREQGLNPELVCCIYPITPLLQAKYLKEGLELLLSSTFDFVYTVTTSPFLFQRALRRDNRGGVLPFFPEAITQRSQDLEPAYFSASQFYWGRAQAFIDNPSFYSKPGAAGTIVVPRHLVQDIDTLEDWTQAEGLYEVFRKKVLKA